MNNDLIRTYIWVIHPYNLCQAITELSNLDKHKDKSNNEIFAEMPIEKIIINTKDKPYLSGFVENAMKYPETRSLIIYAPFLSHNHIDDLEKWDKNKIDLAKNASYMKNKNFFNLPNHTNSQILDFFNENLDSIFNKFKECLKTKGIFNVDFTNACKLTDKFNNLIAANPEISKLTQYNNRAAQELFYLENQKYSLAIDLTKLLALSTLSHTNKILLLDFDMKEYFNPNQNDLGLLPKMAITDKDLESDFTQYKNNTDKIVTNIIKKNNINGFTGNLALFSYAYSTPETQKFFSSLYILFYNSLNYDITKITNLSVESLIVENIVTLTKLNFKTDKEYINYLKNTDYFMLIKNFLNNQKRYLINVDPERRNYYTDVVNFIMLKENFFVFKGFDLKLGNSWENIGKNHSNNFLSSLDIKEQIDLIRHNQIIHPESHFILSQEIIAQKLLNHDITLIS